MAKPKHLALLLSACCLALAANAGIPVRWTTDTFKVKPLSYECYHGETLDLAAALTAYGEPLALGGKTAKLYWQTADMGAEWYETNATVAVDAETGATNILAATFSGVYDTGKDAVKGFVGVVGENYRAAFELKFRASPGFEPSSLPLPAKTIDCAKVTFLNPTNAPWATGGGGGECLVRDVMTNGVSAVAGKVARLVIPSTNGFVTASVTNGLCTTTAAQGMANAARDQAKAHVNMNWDGNYIWLGGSTPANATTVGFSWENDTLGYDGKNINIGGSSEYASFAGALQNGSLIINGEIWIGDGSKTLNFYTPTQVNGTSVTNLGAVVAATNAVANSDNLWTASNAKLTTRINEVSAPIATSANLAIATANNVSNRQDTLEGYIAGQRVRVSVTNYYGNTSGQLPRMRIEEFVTATNVTGGVATETNYWQVVWDEQNKYDRFLAEAKTAISAMTNNLYQTYYALLMERLNTKAPRAWGTLTSAGEAAPAGSVWHTEPNTVFAGGTEYAHAMVGTGVIGVLTTRGAAVYTDGETGRFHFTTDDKQYYFGMNIATRYELGCATDGITVTTVGGNNMVDLLYNVTMTGKPILYYTPSISGNSVVWEQITDSAGGAIPGATVYAAWDQAPPAGSEICTINCGAGVSGFFKASVEYAGSSKFETNMMADLMGGIIATNQTSGQSQPVEPYISNGSVLWRIKQ